jgi:hypothetical protein
MKRGYTISFPSHNVSGVIPVLPNPRERDGNCSAGKAMAMFFWDWQEVFHGDFLTHARTVNAAYYSDLLATKVKKKM